MPYVYAETKAGSTIMIEKYYSSRYKKKGIQRSANISKTCEAQEKVNLRKEIRKLTLKLNANFQYGDYHLVLSYKTDSRPETPEEAKQDRQQFIRCLRDLYRKKGKELKYVVVTEYGKKGALHHHLVTNRFDNIHSIQRVWKKGRIHFHLMEKSGEYSKLASYLLKGRKYWKKHGGKGKQYSCSRNLVTPNTKKHIIRRSSGYYEKPRARKGYYVVLYTEWTGIQENGYPYTSYMLVKDNDVNQNGRRAP